MHNQTRSCPGGSDDAHGLVAVGRCTAMAGFALLAGLAGDARAVTFTDVTAAAGINHVQTTAQLVAGLDGSSFLTGGVAAGDYDGDGFADLIFTRVGLADIFYRNNGNGTFEARTAAAGFTGPTYSNGIVSGDIDNDGDLDLYMTGAAGNIRNFLYLNNGAGVFTDAGQAAVALFNGVPRNGQGASFGDLNRDGYLDLMTTDWRNDVAVNQSRLFINRGGVEAGVFDDATVSTGLDVYRKPQTWRFAPRFVDLDRDGHLDVAIASDFETSQLFWNNGDGTFTDGTLPAGVGTDFNGMGSTFADYDGDGDLDWFITNITAAPENPGPFGGFNRLYRNNLVESGDRTFTDVTLEAGVRDARWGWGTSFFEADNDGDVDLIATNGYNGVGWADDRTFLWENDAGVFTDVSDAAGISDTMQGRGLAHLDYDNDGDLDVVIVNNEGPPVLYRNETNTPGNIGGAFLRIHAQGTVSNRDGIGAFITVTPDLADPHTRQVWEIDGGSSFLSQNEHTAHFGLGAPGSSDGPVDLVTIEWTSGLVQHLHGVAANQTLTVLEADEQAAPGDVNFDGTLDAHDIDWLRVATADAALYRALFGVDADDAGDVNGDAALDTADVDHLISALLGSLPGDANLSGGVEQGDLDAVLSNWGQAVGPGSSASEGGWARGDLNGNGIVEQGDLDAVLSNWGTVAAPDFGSTRVPEPGVAVVLFASVLGYTRRARA